MNSDADNCDKKRLTKTPSQQIIPDAEKKQVTKHAGEECAQAVAVSNHLLSAPFAACILKVMTILANCTKDFPLKIEGSDDTFLHLKTPSSFKGSMYQVNNEMGETFQVAAESMKFIKESLARVPDLMNYCLGAMNNPQDPNTPSIIQWAHTEIENIIVNMVDAAKKVDTKCLESLKLINELSEKSKAVQGHNENRADEVKREIQEKKDQKERLETELREIATELEEQKEVVAEAFSDYKHIMARATDIDDMVSTMILDVLNSAAQSLSRTSTDVLASNLSEGAIRGIKKGFSKKKSLKPAELIAIAEEAVLYKLIKDIMDQNDDEIFETIGSHINKFKSLIHQGANLTDTHKILQKIGKGFLGAFNAGQKDNDVFSKKLADAKEKARPLLEVYQCASDANKAEENDEDKNQAPESLQPKKSFLETRMETVKVAQDAFMLERKIQKEIRKDKYEKEEQIYQVMKVIEQKQIKDADLREILNYIGICIDQFLHMQTAWRDIINFFQHMKIKIDGSMKMHLKAVSTNVKNICQNSIQEVTDFQRFLICSEITKALVVSNVVKQCSELYLEINEQQIEPLLTSARKDNALKQEAAQTQYAMITGNFDNIKTESKRIHSTFTERIEANVYDCLKAYGIDVRAIEPATPPADKPLIEEIVEPNNEEGSGDDAELDN